MASPIRDMHLALAREHQARPAHEMCTSKEEEQIVSSDYFFSMVKPLAGAVEEKSFLRPKKFVHLKEKKTENIHYQDLKEQKKELVKNLKEIFRSNWPDGFKKQLIANARAGKPFNDLKLPFVGNELTPQVLELERAYAAYQAFYQENRVKIKNLTHLFDPNKLTEDQNAFLETKRDKFKEWENNKTVVFEAIREVWKDIHADLYQLCIAGKEIKTFSGTLVSKVKEKLDLKIYGPELGLIGKFIMDEMTKIAEDEKNTALIDDCFREVDPLIQKYMSIHHDDEVNKLIFILKEQKQHAMARFCQLVVNYENFIRHAKIIEDRAEALEKGLGQKVRSSISEIIEHSHYSSVKKEIKQLAGKDDEASQIKLAQLQGIEAKTTVADTHHKKVFMGYQKEDHFKEDEIQHAVHKVNQVLHLHGTAEEVIQFSHAHTFPFPAMFNWKLEKMKEILNAHGIAVEADFEPEIRYISSSFFQTFKQGMDPDTFDQAFKLELEKILVDVKQVPSKFILSALDLLKRYHFRVFSETELVPDFINSVLDKLSEWSTNKGDYKQSIASNLSVLIKEHESAENRLLQEKVSQRLSEFKDQVIIEIGKQMQKLDKEEESIFNLVKRIGTIQIHQAQFLGW